MEEYQRKDLKISQKILMAKYKAGLHSFSEINIENIKNDMNTEIDKALFESVTKKSITLIKNQNNILPIKDLSQKIAYLKIGDSSSDDFFKMLIITPKLICKCGIINK